MRVVIEGATSRCEEREGKLREGLEGKILE